jgi:hypothetical protein
MMSDLEERRASQRLQLAEPIPAKLNDLDALLLDIGVAGALVEHGGSVVVGSDSNLRFDGPDGDIEFICEVVRSTSPQPLPAGVIPFPGAEVEERKYQSGLRFLQALGDSAERLRRMLAEHVDKILRAQQANAMGNREQNVIDGDSTITSLGAARRASESGFLVFRYGEDGWKKTFALLPDQPLDGFTVGAFEDERHLDGLCRAYEDADEQGRRLIRMMAELSINEAKGPPLKSTPK